MINSDILDAAPATFESLHAEHDQNATDLNLDVILDVPVTLSPVSYTPLTLPTTPYL